MTRTRKSQNLKKRTNIYLNVEDIQALQSIGQELDRKPAWLVCLAIKEYIERWREARGR